MSVPGRLNIVPNGGAYNTSSADRQILHIHQYIEGMSATVPSCSEVSSSAALPVPRALTNLPMFTIATFHAERNRQAGARRGIVSAISRSVLMIAPRDVFQCIHGSFDSDVVQFNIKNLVKYRFWTEGSIGPRAKTGIFTHDGL